MHELALMESVVETVRDDARNRGIGQVSRIKLLVGRLTMVMPDSMQFAFQVLSQDDLFKEDAVLEIEVLEAVGRCGSCNQEYVMPENVFSCPGCQSFAIEYIQGHELNIDFYEGDEV